MAKSRLSHVCREQTPVAKITRVANPPAELKTETLVTQILPRPSRSAAPQRYNQLSELEQYKLLVQTATSFRDWQLVSVQTQSDTNVLIGWLVPSYHRGDPSVLVRKGRAMSILVDAVGEMKINQPNSRPVRRSWNGWLRRLVPFIGR